MSREIIAAARETDGSIVHCACGEVIGEACEWSGPIAETETISYVPDWLRGTATAARSWDGLTERARVHHDCAALLRKTDREWIA